MSKNSVRLIVGIVVAVVFCAALVAKSRQAERPQKEPTPAARTRLPAVLDFGRGQCIPCKMMKPILDELQKELAGKVDVKIIDVGDEPDQAYQFNIRLIPTQVFLDAKGEEVHRHEGFMSKEEILAVLKEKRMM